MAHGHFQFSPPELVFKNFTPWQTYKETLHLLNKSKVSQQLNLAHEESEYFRVVCPVNRHRTLAPGMTAVYCVFFTPHENKDYHHKLFFVTETKWHEVPIRAIGPRAILDIRDEFDLGRCAVKSFTETTHYVRNIGNAKAMFELHTQKPFSVAPSCGSLDVGEGTQVTVTLQPVTIREHTQMMKLHYHTGEDVYIKLRGVCEELDFHLECDSVLLRETYISTASIHTLSLSNSNDTTVHCRWSAWCSQEEEDQNLVRESSEVQKEQRLLFQHESDPAAIQCPPPLARFLLENRGQGEPLLVLSDGCITVEPVEQEIYPKRTTHFFIIFKPEEAKLYKHTIYCDVTGRTSRLPLTIRGQGMGPTLQLKYNLWDMNNVFIGDKDYYEVPVTNTGDIDAPFRMSRPDTTFGRCFSFSPEEGVVAPKESQIVKVTFHCNTLGAFSEDLLLTVTGQPQPHTLTFRGCVVAPVFHFDVSELRFGDVAFGSPVTLPCTLFNTSFVAMTFSLRVVGDGLGSPSITNAQQVSEKSRNSWQGSTATDLHTQPVEFTVKPAASSVRAMSDVTFEVTLCSNTVKEYSVALEVDVEGVGKKTRALPISARCVVPNVVLETPVLDFGRCFLNYPYQQEVQLTNSSNVAACYGVLDQEYDEDPSLLFDSPTPRGLIPPASSVRVPVSLQAKAVGTLCHTLRIAVFGSVQPPLEVVLSCVGQGPEVHADRRRLEFGEIPALTDITRTLQLSNQSPIPAHFTAHVIKGKSHWRVQPSEGQVAPKGVYELEVVSCLKNTGHVHGHLNMSITDGSTVEVDLSATGTGTTIVTDRPFGTGLDLGTHWRHEICQYMFKITNLGQQRHLMYWHVDVSDSLSCGKARKGVNWSGQVVIPPISHNKKKIKSVFSVTPFRVELFPGESADMVLTGMSHSKQEVREVLQCHGIVGQDGYKDHIMSVPFTCHFVESVLRISTHRLDFSIDKEPGESLRAQEEKLILKNESPLPLPIELSLKEPFFLCEEPGDHSSATAKSVVIEQGSQAELWVRFIPPNCQDRLSCVIDEFLIARYPGKSRNSGTDRVQLHAEVYFPSLCFSSTAVDFGCVPNCTECLETITITNCSPLPVSYHWVFLEDPKIASIRIRKSPALSDPPSTEPDPVGVEQVFDICPILGHLRPEEQQLIVFSFYGHKNISGEVVAQCRVDDGPTYDVLLRGETSP